MGTFGIGILSQLMNFNGLILFISSLGLPLGITKVVSELESENKWDDLKKIVNQILSFFILLSILLILISVLFSEYISMFLFDSREYSIYVQLIVLSIPFSLSIALFDSYLRGLKKFNLYVKTSIFISIISVIISLVFIIYLNLLGAIISFLISSVVGFVFYVYVYHKNKILSFKEIFKFEFKYNKIFDSIIKIGLASLIVGFIEQFIALFMRSFIIKELGINSNGIYQSVFSISNNYFNILYMSIGIYLLPILSGYNNREKINNEINSTLRLTLITIIPVISLVFIFRNIIIILLYNENFLQASDLMAYNIIGDFFKALAWILGSWLIPTSKIKLWVILSILFPINNLIIFLINLLIFKWGLESVVISYAIANLIHFILNLYFIFNLHKFRFSKINLSLLIRALLFLTIILVLSSYNVTFGYMVILPIMFLWLKYSITNEEFTKLYDYIKHIFNKINIKIYIW